MKQNYKSKLQEFAECIKENHHSESDIGVLNGLSGMALFLFYCADLTEEEAYEDLGMELLGKCLDQISAGFNIPTYSKGISGFYWVMNHLEEKGMMATEDKHMFDVLDDYLYGFMIEGAQNNNVDFMHGSLGTAFTFLKKLKLPLDDSYRSKYTGYLQDYIDILEGQINQSKEGMLTWTDYRYPEELSYNLSLSHGLSSVLNFFVRLYEMDVHKQRSAEMIQKISAFLLKYYREDERNLSFFPGRVNTKKSISYSGRLAWCYGDLGTSWSLNRAAKALQNKEMEKIALKTMQHSTGRTTKETTFIQDAMMCHGAFGVAQVYNYIHKTTQKEVFQSATEFWMQDGLDKDGMDDSYAGYRYHDHFSGWQKSLGILNGISGIGLTMIEQLSDKPLDWDECLLLS